MSFWLPRLFSFLHARNKLLPWFEMLKLQFCITKRLILKNNYDYILKTQITNPVANPLQFWRSLKQVWLKSVLLITAVTWSTSFLVITAVKLGTQVMRAERHFSCSSLDSSPISCIFIHWKYFISCQLFLVFRVLFQFIHFSCSQSLIPCLNAKEVSKFIYLYLRCCPELSEVNTKIPVSLRSTCLCLCFSC